MSGVLLCPMIYSHVRLVPSLGATTKLLFERRFQIVPVFAKQSTLNEGDMRGLVDSSTDWTPLMPSVSERSYV